MSDYDIWPKPKVLAGSVHSLVEDVVSSQHTTLGQSSAKHSALICINYVTKISLNDKGVIYLSKQVSDQFR